MPDHQSQLAPAENKFHAGNGEDGKHYWLTPPDVLDRLAAEFGPFDFDPCPHPLPAGFDGLTCEWGERNYVNPPFGSIMHQGRKKGPTAWVRKALEEWRKGKTVVLVYPLDKWILVLLKAIIGEHGDIRNLGDVRWLSTGGRHRRQGNRAAHRRLHLACIEQRRGEPMNWKWEAIYNPETWALVPTILVGVDRHSCQIALAWLPFCAGVDITW